MTNLTDNLNSDSNDEFPKHESERTIVTGEIKAAVQHLSETNPSIGALLSSVDGESVINTISTVVFSYVKEHNSSPYPSPQQLREINQVLPNGADRLFSMTEQEQKYRHEREKRLIDLNHDKLQLEHKVAMTKIAINERSLGIWGWQVLRRQCFALILSLGVLGCGFWLMLNKESALGVAVIATNFVGIALAFLHEKRKKSEKDTPPEADGAAEEHKE